MGIDQSRRLPGRVHGEEVLITTPLAERKQELLLGRLTWAELLGVPAWADAWALPYDPDADAIAAIAASSSAVELWAFVATWCGDCKRELPRLHAILSAAGWQSERLHLIGVDRSKRDPEGLTAAWAITRVPTFIAVRAGVELGRIVERPSGSLEGHLAHILQR